MENNDAARAALGALTALISGGATVYDGEVFARVLTEAAADLPNGEEDLLLGALLLGAGLVDMCAAATDTSRSDVLQAMALSIATTDGA